MEAEEAVAETVVAEVEVAVETVAAVVAVEVIAVEEVAVEVPEPESVLELRSSLRTTRDSPESTSTVEPVTPS